MKKKLIAIAIAAAVAAPLTAQAAVTVSGDAEFKMTNRDSTGVTATAGNWGSDETWGTADDVAGSGEDSGGWSGSNRVRVKIDADLAGGVSVHTRFRTTTGFDNSSSDNGTVTALTVDTDYSYIVVPVGPVTLTMGDQLATWGTKYFADGARKDNRLKAAYKATSQLTLLATLDPIGDENADGAPKMTFYAITKLSNMMTAGIVYTGETTTYNGTPAGQTNDAVSNVFVKGNMAGVTFGVESTDWSEYDGSRSLYLMAGMKAAGANVGFHYAKAGSQDSDWSPVGVINGNANLAGGLNEYTVITANMKMGGMDVTAGVGTAGNDAVGGSNESLVGVDLGKKFGAANFNLSFGSYNSTSAYGFSFKTKF